MRQMATGRVPGIGGHIPEGLGCTGARPEAGRPGRVTWSGMAAVQELEGIINPFKYRCLAAGRGLGPCFFLSVCPSLFPEPGRQQV